MEKRNPVVLGYFRCGKPTLFLPQPTGEKRDNRLNSYKTGTHSYFTISVSRRGVLR